MFKHYFELIENVSVWPIISFSIFFGFFLILIIWLFKVDKGYITKMKNLPLDDQSPDKREGSSKLKMLISLLAVVTLPVSLFAQESINSGMDRETLVTWLVLIVVVISILVLIVAIYTLNVLKIALKGDRIIVPERESNWSKLWDRFNKRVPAEKETTILLDHNYDGIRELDNHLPPWWTISFYLSIVFAVVYMLVYHVFDMAPLPGELYDIEVAEAKMVAAARLAGADAAGGCDNEMFVGRGLLHFVENAAICGDDEGVVFHGCCGANNLGGRAHQIRLIDHVKGGFRMHQHRRIGIFAVQLDQFPRLELIMDDAGALP